VVFGAIWTGLLVVCLSLVLLEVRTPSLPLAHAALVAMLGLGLAGICGAACPDQHFLHWWFGTAIGGRLVAGGGHALGMLLALLAPGIALQSIDTSWAVFSGWLLDSGAGGYAGVAGGGRLRPLLASALLRTRR
jgi:hypothetical protein